MNEEKRKYHRERAARLYRTNPEYRERVLEASKKWQAKNKESVAAKRKTPYVRLQKRLRKYKMNYEQLQELREIQFWRCGICYTPEWIEELVIDHCHKTGKVRGLLCNSCNSGLGMFKNDVERLRVAFLYLTQGIL